eukprot:XP_017946419.1 PREDICTED: uncharacterized protein LOC105946347 [Xenopus tropicalis]
MLRYICILIVESRSDEDSLSHNDEGPQELQEGEESAACEAWPSQEDDGSHDGEEEGVIQVVPRKKRRRAILTTNAGMFMMLTRIQKQLVNVQRTLNILCQNQRPCVTHNDTIMRRAVSAEERLCITIRYLATGQSFSALYYQFLVGRSTISCIVRETCTVIWEQLQPNVMPQPTEKSWLHIAEEYYGKTNFPNGLGALDGKHVRMIMPPNSGSKYWNYKKFFSLVLLAVVDANYCFTIIDVGAYGSSGDANAFKNSIFYKKLNAGRLQLPQPRPLPRTDGPPLPFVFIGDEAFGLSEHLMRPYPSNQRSIEKRVFNYRLSRARRMVECTFGIMSNKW